MSAAIPPAPSVVASPPAAPASSDDPLASLAEFPALANTARRALARPRTGIARVVAKPALVLRKLGAAVVPYVKFYEGSDSENLGFLLLGSAPDAALDVESDGCGFIAPKSEGELVWDLRGNGSQWVVFSEMNGGVHCSQGGDEAYELVAGRWILPGVVPQYPTRIGDANGDGAPDFPTHIVSVNLGACAWVECSAYSRIIGVEGYERWDGSRLSHDPAPFRDVYAGDYAALVEFSKRPDESGEDNPPTCAIGSARSAAAAYAYGVLSGRPESEALALAARFMKGKSLSGCRTPDDKPNLSWAKALQIVRANVKALAPRP